MRLHLPPSARAPQRLRTGPQLALAWGSKGGASDLPRCLALFRSARVVSGRRRRAAHGPTPRVRPQPGRLPPDRPAPTRMSTALDCCAYLCDALVAVLAWPCCQPGPSLGLHVVKCRCSVLDTNGGVAWRESPLASLPQPLHLLPAHHSHSPPPHQAPSPPNPTLQLPCFLSINVGRLASVKAPRPPPSPALYNTAGGGAY
jgi:hypothetical protein